MRIHIYIYKEKNKHAFKALLLLSRSFPLQSDSEVQRHVKARGQNSLQLRCANTAVTAPFLQLPHYIFITFLLQKSTIIVPPGGERHWVDLTSSALREEGTAGHLTAMGSLSKKSLLVYHYILYFDVLVHSYHTLCLEWLCSHSPWKRLCQPCLCVPLLQSAVWPRHFAVFYCLAKCALIRY